MPAVRGVSCCVPPSRYRLAATTSLAVLRRRMTRNPPTSNRAVAVSDLKPSVMAGARLSIGPVLNRICAGGAGSGVGVDGCVGGSACASSSRSGPRRSATAPRSMYASRPTHLWRVPACPVFRVTAFPSAPKSPPPSVPASAAPAATAGRLSHAASQRCTYVRTSGAPPASGAPLRPRSQGNSPAQ